MNINALKISINSLIEAGDLIINGKVDEKTVRNYIDLYENIKEYLKSFSNQNEVFRIAHEKLPIIKYQGFHNYYYLMKTFLFEKVKWHYRSAGGVRISDLFEIDSYPARSKYLNDLTMKISEITKIIRELYKVI